MQKRRNSDEDEEERGQSACDVKRNMHTPLILKCETFPFSFLLCFDISTIAIDTALRQLVSPSYHRLCSLPASAAAAVVAFQIIDKSSHDPAYVYLKRSKTPLLEIFFFALLFALLLNHEKKRG